jgi:hypothetical protein
MSNLKLSLLLVVAGVLALAPCGQAALPNLVQNPMFITAPGDPVNYAADNWAYYNTAVTIGTTGQTSIVTQESPSGLRMASVNYANAGGTSAERSVYQVIPVIAGATYQVNAQWKGFLKTDGATTTNSRTSCNVYVAFATSSTGTWTGDRTVWYKRLSYNRQIDSWNVPMSCFTPSNQATYDFSSAYENASLSPATNQTIPGDAPIVVPAGMTYMRLRLGFTSEVQPANSGGTAFVVFNNVAVTGCQGAVAGDTDADCDVDKFDLANVANTWLSCGNSSNNTLCW